MNGRIGCLLFVSVVLLVSAQPTQAGCIDPTRLAHSTVSITRYFDDAEREASRELAGVRGTGWFLSPAMIVTAEHVTAGMNLSVEDWKPIEVVDGAGRQSVAARIRRLAGSQSEKLAVIELQNAVSTARSVEIRRKPLAPEEEVMTFAYPEGRLQPVGGRFVRFGDSGKLAGLALLEMYEGENRLVIDHGASGAPVIDCDGRVAAVISNVFTQRIVFAAREIRISTAWGMPNVVSVPVQALDDTPGAEETTKDIAGGPTGSRSLSIADNTPVDQQRPNSITDDRLFAIGKSHGSP
jgi:Trypsin-like peptidase domain